MTMKMSALERYVSEVKACQSQLSVSQWELAKKLAEGEASGVWKTRMDANGKLKYGNFDVFAQIELGMSGKYVRTMLKLFARFTEEEFKTHRPSRLQQVLACPVGMEAKVLAALRKGASKRELQAMWRRPDRSGLAPVASIVREHARGGVVRIDMISEENRLMRVHPLSDLLVLAKLAERIYQDKMRAGSKSTARKVSAA